MSQVVELDMPQADFTSNESQDSDTKPAMKVCTSVHRPQYVSRRRDLECFNGTNGIDVEDWVEDVKEHLSGTGYDAEYMAEFVRDHVMGIAKRELRARKLCKPGVEVSDMYDALISTLVIWGMKIWPWKLSIREVKKPTNPFWNYLYHYADYGIKWVMIRAGIKR